MNALVERMSLNVQSSLNSPGLVRLQGCCPHHRRIHGFSMSVLESVFLQTFPELKKNYIDTGKVRFYSMDFPLGMHDKALLAAQAGGSE